MAFQGSLKELPLPDIIQLVSVSGKTGVFALETGDQTGEIYLVDGAIVDARVGDVRGEEAIYELAIWQEGEFLFNPGIKAEERTVSKTNTNLLMEAARRIDEWQVLSKRIPSTRVVPVFTSQGSTSSVSFTPREWSVICKIDERRTIEQLAVVLGMSAFDVCKLLYGLVTAGLVELQESSSGVPAERLESLATAELVDVAGKIYEQAKTLLAANPEKLPEIEAASRRTQTEMESGRGAQAVLDLINSLEKVVSAALGPNQSQLFVDRVNQLLSG